MNGFSLVSTVIGTSTYHGLVREAPGAKTMVVHVHGTGGDFFTNPFINPLADLYSQFGMSFVTANFPGWGEQAATEKFTDFSPALDEWLNALKWNGSLLLQGHSLGALKVIHYLRNAASRASHRVRAVVLLAPFDVVSFYCGGGEDRAQEVRNRIDAEAGDDKTLVPKGIFAEWPISVGTFRELIVDSGPADQFPSRKGVAGGKLADLSLPVFAAIGSEDFAAFPSVAEVMRQLKSVGVLTAHEIGGAPHNFAGQTDQLVQCLRRWLAQNSSNLA